jgi:CDP-diacylglycerol--glycerol-3-phosphate 3-phosphatidyltransferase
MNLANQISVTRLVSAPLLLLLAWHQFPRTFLVVLLFAFSTDVLDGFIARTFHQQSELGARLDSWGDYAIYLTVPLGGWWLWPEIIRQEAVYFVLGLAGFTLPGLVGLLKFGSLTSYHTWGVKIAALAVGSSVLILFAGGPAWPFRLAVPISVLAALEEVAITLVLTEKRSDVPSLWHAMRHQR